MRILNAYAGIGGNRRLWGDTHEITAIEYKPEIAKIYQDFFPNDKVIIADAHQYLLEHFKEFDFIWSSPPCPSHSKIRNQAGVGCGQNEPIYPDMKLYEEIIFLQYFCKAKYCVENVVGYYKPLIPPQEINLHYFWTNFFIPKLPQTTRNHFSNKKTLELLKGFDLSAYRIKDKIKILRNCVEPETGKYVLDRAIKQEYKTLF